MYLNNFTLLYTYVATIIFFLNISCIIFYVLHFARQNNPIGNSQNDILTPWLCHKY